VLCRKAGLNVVDTCEHERSFSVRGNDTPCPEPLGLS
jgi:hypothetical protein